MTTRCSPSTRSIARPLITTAVDPEGGKARACCVLMAPHYSRIESGHHWVRSRRTESPVESTHYPKPKEKSGQVLVRTPAGPHAGFSGGYARGVRRSDIPESPASERVNYG